ncbi:MAG: tyrosine-type recombinase/integrase [candidate division Zixibacteria bacterium]|nr:tyrosine-type recombinase/integrase [candidate division Zixibacteria bacterium]
MASTNQSTNPLLDQAALTVRCQASGIISASEVKIQTLIDDFLCRRSEKTRRAYESDLSHFAAFIGATSNPSALSCLVTAGQGNANGMVLSYKSSMIERGLSPATINRRLATIRSAIKLARQLGLVNWSIEIENEKTQPYRDTTGTGKQGVKALLEQAAGNRNRFKATRDVAILRLLYDLALRRGEIVSLNLDDFDPDSGTLAVLGKGRTQKVAMTLPEPTQNALKVWLEVRGMAQGPMFINCDRAGKGATSERRLTGSAVYYLVRDLGRKAGMVARPHGLRHAAITEALDLTGGDVRKAQRFSRHRNMQTLTVYDDSRLDLAGEVAKMVAGSVSIE